MPAMSVFRLSRFFATAANLPSSSTNDHFHFEFSPKPSSIESMEKPILRRRL